MKVKYQITMEVEVDFDPKTEHLSSLKLDLAGKAKVGFVNCTYTLPDATVTKVKVSRIGATEANSEKAGTSFNGFKKLGDKKVEPVKLPIFHKPVNADLIMKATEGYMCGCGAFVDEGIELHICPKCQTKMCPNCFDHNKTLCEECISS